MPHHKLTLKVGTTVMLLRNIDPRIGLCKGTRLLRRVFHRNLIDSVIIVSHFSETKIHTWNFTWAFWKYKKCSSHLQVNNFDWDCAFALQSSHRDKLFPMLVCIYWSTSFNQRNIYVCFFKGCMFVYDNRGANRTEPAFNQLGLVSVQAYFN